MKRERQSPENDFQIITSNAHDYAIKYLCPIFVFFFYKGSFDIAILLKYWCPELILAIGVF